MLADICIDDTTSRIVGVFAIIVDLQAVRTVEFLFRALAFALLAVDAAVLRALLGSYDLILARLQTPLALITSRLCFVALDFLLATPDTRLVLSKLGRR
jgi:hypothetical protein